MTLQRFRDHRIYTHHEREFDRGREITIDFEGHPLRAFSKEPVAVALYAWGVRVASRSMKFHRPRGLFCLGGRCMSCLARVDGLPSVRTCRVPCRDGMKVRRENAIPQATDDLLHTLDFVFPRTLHYQEMFTRPLALNKLLQKSVRMFSGAGDLPDQELPVRRASDHRRRRPGAFTIGDHDRPRALHHRDGTRVEFLRPQESDGLLQIRSLVNAAHQKEPGQCSPILVDRSPRQLAGLRELLGLNRRP